VRVRQALNYAVNRARIAEAVYGRYGTPISQPTVPGQDGYVGALEERYRYDAARARQLLAEAGYGRGFALPVLTAPLSGLEALARIIAADFDAIGVRLDIVSAPTFAQYLSAVFAGEYPAVVAPLGAAPVLVAWEFALAPNAAWNPFHSEDPELTRLRDQLATVEPREGLPIARQITSLLVEKAWFVPVAATPLATFYRPDIAGVQMTAQVAVPNIVDFHRT
jgi:peptide/nickel transport system substrate-binding protein